VVSLQSNDQRLLERILEDQHRKLAPDKGRDDFFTFFAADKALQDWGLDNEAGQHGPVLPLVFPSVLVVARVAARTGSSFLGRWRSRLWPFAPSEIRGEGQTVIPGQGAGLEEPNLALSRGGLSKR
jgi:hypothetical protein